MYFSFYIRPRIGLIKLELLFHSIDYIQWKVSNCPSNSIPFGNTNKQISWSVSNCVLAHIHRVKRMSVETVYYAIVYQKFPSYQCLADAWTPVTTLVNSVYRQAFTQESIRLYILDTYGYDTTPATWHVKRYVRYASPRTQCRINFARPIFKLFKNHSRLFQVPRCNAAATDMPRKWHGTKAMLMRHPRSGF